jgi:hypothetical protein
VEALIFADPALEAVTYPLEFTVATPLTKLPVSQGVPLPCRLPGFTPMVVQRKTKLWDHTYLRRK